MTFLWIDKIHACDRERNEGNQLLKDTPEGCKKISRWLASEASVTTGCFAS
jgi:hypothetical protein